MIVAPAGLLTGCSAPTPQLHTLALTEFEAWARCWRAGYRTAHEHQGLMQARLEREGYRCCHATVSVEVVP